MAPPTTGRAMLLEQGIVPLPPQEMPADADLHDELWTVIEGLASAGVYLLHTDPNDENVLYFYEKYTSGDALAAHAGADWFKSFGPKLGPVLAGRPDMKIVNPVGGKGH